MNAIEPLINWLLDPAMRTFYGYWPSCMLIALGWAALNWQKRRHLMMKVIQRDYWLNPSCYQDYALIFFNRALFGLLAIGWFVFTINISLNVFRFLRLFSDATEPGSISSSLGIVATYTLILFLLDDASRYLLHRVLHKFSFLWRIHQLHHSATVLTPLTTLRIHPLESLMYQLRSSLVHGICAGCGFYFLGFQADSLQIWGATLWVVAFNALGANLRHSPVNISYGYFEKIFISPSQHQAHHGVKTMNYNYGSILSIWDRLAGSWRSGQLPYELPKEAQSLKQQLLLKFVPFK